MTDTATALVKLDNVVKHFPLRRRGFGPREFVHSVDDVTIRLDGGRSLGIVGESGSGKSTLARIMLGLQEPDSGQVDVAGVRVTGLKRPASGSPASNARTTRPSGARRRSSSRIRTR